MKLSLLPPNKKELSKFVAVANAKSPLPILANLKLNATNGLEVFATNLEVAIKQYFDAIVLEPGSTTISCKKFVDILDRLDSNQTIEITSTDHKLNILQGASKFELPTLNVDNYPVIDDVEGREFDISQEALVLSIKRTAYACSTDDSRFNLNTIYVVNDTIVATDGHRLSKSLFPTDIGCSVLLPIQGCITLLKSLKGTGRCKLKIDKKFVGVTDDNTSISIRLTDGEFPDFNKVIPKEPGKEVVINRHELISAVKRVAPMVTQVNMGINMNIKNNLLTISKISELGSAEDSIPVEFNDELEAIMNVKYFTECLGALEGDTVMMSYSKEGAPIVFVPEIDPTILHLVMPMRK